MQYNWQQPDWPNFCYTLTEIQDILFAFSEKVGRVEGILNTLSDEIQKETILDVTVMEAVKTSEIEGEYVSRPDVIASIRYHLGLGKEPEKIKDKFAQGVAKLMLDVRETFNTPLSHAELFKWHQMLFPKQKWNHINIGQWRTHEDAMQVVSGHLEKWTVHYEAPPSSRVPLEMQQFIGWFNSTAPGASSAINPAPVRSAIAHLYFESIHPFEDGNGRIGRAIAEKALSQGIGRPILLSLSQIIMKHKKAYYNALKQAQRSNDITHWIDYFVHTIYEAQVETEKKVDFILQKTKFFDCYKHKLELRQTMVMQRMFQEGPEGFKGGMSAKKYSAITGVSKATATRDLHDLTEMGALQKIGEGPGTRYLLIL